MIPSPRPRRLFVPILVAAWAFAVGCNSKDDSANPAGSSGTAVTSEDVALSALDTMTFANEFLSEIRSLAEADFSSVTFEFGDAYQLPRRVGLVRDGMDPGRSADEIVYNEAAGAWIYEYTEQEATEDGTASASIYFLVQYLNGSGTPQVEPDGTTQTMNLEVAMTLEAAGQDAGESYAIALDYGLDYSIGGMQTGPYEVDGNGDVAADFFFSGEGGVIDFDLAMGWLMDVDVPIEAGACPTGTLSMTFDSSESDAYSFSATYAGSSSVSWTLYEGGAAVESGTESIDCGTPAL
jgi:hypothetical protein